MNKKKKHTVSDISSNGMRFDVKNIRSVNASDIPNASKDKAYIEFVLMHSYPSINGNGATLMPKVIQNSLDSLINSPLDIDHELEGVWFWEKGDDNRIIGSIVGAKLSPEYKEDFVPTNGYEVVLTAVLWKRLSDVKGIIQDIIDDTAEWKASFEIAPYSVKDQISYIWNGQIFNENEISVEMKDAFEWGYNHEGSPVAVAFGGEDGQIDFYGAALTLTPADINTKINKLVAKETNSMNPEELAKQIAVQTRAIIAEENSKYDGYLSPKEVEAKIATAKEEIETKYKEYVSANDVQTRIDEAVKASNDTMKTQYDVFIVRLDAMRDKGIDITDERKNEVFSATDAEFTTNIDTWSKAVTEMEQALVDGGVEINDELKQNIATWNGKEDTRFKALIAALGSKAPDTEGSHVPNPGENAQMIL